MARAPRTSAASYALFQQRAWNQLSNVANAGLNTGQRSTLLYRQCYTPLLDAVPAKVALTGGTLMTQMSRLLSNAGITGGLNDRRVHIQGGNDLTNAHRQEYAAWSDYLSHWAITRFLCCCCLPEPQALSATANAGTRGYLHIYATDGRVENNNWRIAVNLHPSSIADAVGAVCTVLDNNADVGHFKVSAPGMTSKPDSLIVYMRRRNATYNGIVAAVQNAVQNLNIQETFNPMWEEIALGQAVCAEPPRIAANANHSVSFGRFRCLVTAIAFETAVAQDAAGVVGNVTQPQFNNRMDAAFVTYGMPVANPENQQQLALAANNADNQAFMRAYALYKQQPANTYTNQNAVFGNRPVYP